MGKRLKIMLATALAFLLFGNVGATAQDYSMMNLRFIYISHEPGTPVGRLWEKIRAIRNDAVEIDDALIVYLADGRQPLVSFTNLKDPDALQRDRDEAFFSINAALQDAIAHDVIAKEDRKNILRLFDQFNFVTDDGQLRFNSVAMDFYVGPSFWALGNNLQVIAHLYTAFGAASYPKDKLSFSVYKPKGQDLGEDANQLFGDNNIDGINQKLSMFEY